MNFVANGLGPRGNQNFGYQAAAPQYASSTSMRQYANPTPMSQYQNRAPVLQYENRGPMPQYENRGPMSQYDNRRSMPQYENRAPMPQYENRGPMPQYVNRASVTPQYANASAMPPQYTSSQRMYSIPTTLPLPPQFVSTKTMPQPQFQTQYTPQYTTQQSAQQQPQQYATQYEPQYSTQTKFPPAFVQASPMSQQPQFSYVTPQSPYEPQQFALPNGLVSHLPTAEEFLQDEGMGGQSYEPSTQALMMQQMQNMQRVQDEFEIKKRQEELQKQLNMPSYADLMNNSYNDYMDRQQLFRKQDQRSAQMLQGMFSQSGQPKSTLRSFTPEQFSRMMQQQQMPGNRQKAMQSEYIQGLANGSNSRQMIVPYSPTSKMSVGPGYTRDGVNYRY